MKITIVLGLLTSSFLISSAFAMEAMMDNTMMHKDTMTTSSDAMMKDEAIKMDLTKMSLIEIAKHCGYNWQKDRVKLAKMAGIKNYRGTVKQNLMIRAYLLSDKGMKDAMMNKEAMTK